MRSLCWMVIAVVACACPPEPQKPGAGAGAGSAGSGSSVAAAPTKCADVRAKVEQLYRAEAQVKEPTRVDEAARDNTQMVMTDCNKDPATRVPCLVKADTVAAIEKDCLAPLDPEGTEGQQ